MMVQTPLTLITPRHSLIKIFTRSPNPVASPGKFRVPNKPLNHSPKVTTKRPYPHYSPFTVPWRYPRVATIPWARNTTWAICPGTQFEPSKPTTKRGVSRPQITKTTRPTKRTVPKSYPTNHTTKPRTTTQKARVKRRVPLYTVERGPIKNEPKSQKKTICLVIDQNMTFYQRGTGKN